MDEHADFYTLPFLSSPNAQLNSRNVQASLPKQTVFELIRNLKLLNRKEEMTNVVPMFFSDACSQR